jgi:CRISPR/Cas system-associated exonuclease Cas4 (RecB family)
LTGCLAKAYFSRTREIQESVGSAWAKLRGSLLHYVVRSLGWSELRVSMRFQLNGEDITIVGHVDAYDPETATIFDLKTSRFVKWQSEKGFIPRDNHTAQVQSYYTMLDAYAIPVNRLVLVYVDDKEIIPLEVPLGNRREWLIQRASTLHSSLLNNRLPEPEPNSWCKYCPFSENCPQSLEANGNVEDKT